MCNVHMHVRLEPSICAGALSIPWESLELSEEVPCALLSPSLVLFCSSCSEYIHTQ